MFSERIPSLRRFCLLVLALSALSACAVTPPSVQSRAPQIPAEVSNAEWERDMQRFAAEDQAAPPPKRAVLFVGSSSIRLWETLAQDFPGVPVINRGFGGSEVRDSTWYADRIIVPYRPRMILLYAGDNDIAAGRTPQQVHADFIAFIERVRRDLPRTKIVYIATKPSPSRAHLLEAQRQANALVREEAQRRGVTYVDVFTPMLDANGQPREDLFVEDRLHMNRAGYELWRDLIAPLLR